MEIEVESTDGGVCICGGWCSGSAAEMAALFGDAEVAETESEGEVDDRTGSG